MLVFTGENGLTSDGLVAISTDLLVSIINSHGTCLRLVVLNGCKTFDAAQAILLQCPTVDHCVCWMTPVHSEAAAVFATAVCKAFHGAKAAVLEQVQLGRLRGVGPIGTPLQQTDSILFGRSFPVAGNLHAISGGAINNREGQLRRVDTAGVEQLLLEGG